MQKPQHINRIIRRISKQCSGKYKLCIVYLLGLDHVPAKETLSPAESLG